MAIMTFDQFQGIFNGIIFEKSKSDLLEKISSSPSRYIGLFRPTKPRGKILQNLLQSHEIRFGDAFETLIEEYFKLKGSRMLPKRLTNTDGDALSVDQLFEMNGKVYFIEQKVRDDHDSTKKRGQIQNFEKKLSVLLNHFSEKSLEGIIYFIDPELTKNKNYYLDELKKIGSDYNVKLYLYYGKELYVALGLQDIWEEIILYLEEWKKEIPDLPEINFDLNAENTFEEIKDLSPQVYRKLLSDDNIFNEILTTIFPSRTTLGLLLSYFKTKQSTIYRTLAYRLSERLK